MIKIGSTTHRIHGISRAYYGSRLIYGWRTTQNPDPLPTGDYHVTVDGSDSMTADGSLENPWSLKRSGEQVQAQYSSPKPGETVLIHAGVYNISSTTIWHSGTAGNPITYRSARDGIVVLKGAVIGNQGQVMVLNGNYLTLRDVVITCEVRNRVNDTSSTDRYAGISGQIGIVGSWPGYRVINCIIYDVVGNGISSSGDGTDSEYYGNIIFNNGHYAPLYPAGVVGVSHGMYMSNNADTRRIEHNILFNSYGHGIQFYTESVQQLAGLDLLNNTIFNAGGASAPGGIGVMYNFMIGGNSPLTGIVADGNASYLMPMSHGTHLQFGYNNDGEDFSITNSLVMGGGNTFIHPLRMKNAIVKNNTVIPAASSITPLMQIIYPENDPVEIYDIDENTYFSDRTGDVFKTGYVTDYTIAEWRALGYDVNSQILPRSSLVNTVKIEPNKYENGRAHVTIFNHLELTNVLVDLSAVYNVGDTYYMYDVQGMDNVMGPFTYDGNLVSFPMNLTSVKQSVGNPGTGFTIAHTPIEFGCFVVCKRQIF